MFKQIIVRLYLYNYLKKLKDEPYRAFRVVLFEIKYVPSSNGSVVKIIAARRGFTPEGAVYPIILNKTARHSTFPMEYIIEDLVQTFNRGFSSGLFRWTSFT